nr:diguanylate cyclase [uncultured Holophaga sp.]
MVAWGLRGRVEALQGEWAGTPQGELLAELLHELDRADARLGKLSRISDRYQAQLRLSNAELGQALAEVRTLQGFIPICAKCKRIRDDQGFWEQVESYLVRHSGATFSHGVCPECARELFPGTQTELHGGVEGTPCGGRHGTAPQVEGLESYLRELEERGPESGLSELRDSVRSHLALQRRFDKVVRISDAFQAELKRLNAVLAEASRTDSLTGLLNRRGLGAVLKSEMARSLRSGLPFSVLMLDLDHFKAINDTYGHELGDRVLEHLADRLGRELRDYDSVGRWGGEEFLVLLPGASAEEAWRVAEKIRTGLASGPLSLDGFELRLSLCAGVAQWVSGESLASLLQRADDACYESKRLGRNRSHMAP